MENMLIQKTHYEMVKEILHSRKLFNLFDLDTFISQTNSYCGKNPSFDEFARSPFIQQVASLIETPKDKSVITVYCNVLYHLYAMYQNHERIYYVCPKLAMDLARTELNIDSYFLKSPFPEIYIQIDPGLYYLSDECGEHPVRGFYVNLREDGDNKLIRIMAAALKGNYAEIGPSNDDALFYFKFNMGPGKIKEQLQTYIEGTVKPNESELKAYGGYYNMNHIQELFLFVLNTLLYITSKDADILRQLPMKFNEKVSNMKSKAKIRKLLQRQAKTTSLPILVMGSKFISEYTLDQVKGNGGIGRWKLDKKLYVSGHWRHQWYGSGEARKADLIYIRPYEKGPDIAEVLDRRYQIGKD
jgi:hypothetical protein